ncbi:tetratricopeptide repeat protein [Brachyspira pulli]|uniref:tetratricopeptide repeat protein n=1 Tax=Brachyspira pulli TaxID=310721 RepID=UPI0030040A37
MKKAILIILSLIVIQNNIYSNPALQLVVNGGKYIVNLIAPIIFEKGINTISSKLASNDKDIKKLESYISERNEKEAYKLLIKLIADKKIDEIYIPMYYLKIAYITDNYYNTIKYLDIIIDSYPNSEYFNDAYYLRYFYRGFIDYEEEEYDSAIKNLKNAANLKPNSEYSWYWLGRAYYSNEDYNKATESFNKAINLNPNDGDNWYWLGIAYLYNQNYNKAIESFNKAVNLNPNEENYYFALGGTYYNNKDYNKAIESLNKAVRLNPNNEESWYWLGTAYLEIKNIIKRWKVLIKL